MQISTGFYQHKLHRFMTMIRGSLVSFICFYTVDADSSTSASAALTLTGPDVSTICNSFAQVHEIWANVIEVGLAMFLLQRELGLGCIGPGITVIRKPICQPIKSFQSSHLRCNQALTEYHSRYHLDVTALRSYGASHEGVGKCDSNQSHRDIGCPRVDERGQDAGHDRLLP